jgi:hypothetical protein
MQTEILIIDAAGFIGFTFVEFHINSIPTSNK